MMGRSHASIGALVGLGIGAAMWGTGRPELVVCSVLVGGGAGLLPDIDEENSTVSRAGGVATVLVSHVTTTVTGGHRRATHSLFGIAVCCFGLWLASSLNPFVVPVVAGLLAALMVRVVCSVIHLGRVLRWVAEGVVGAGTGWAFVGGKGVAVVAVLAAGMVSHTLADDLTDSGTPLFWPCRWRFSLHLFHTGSRSETVVQWCLFAGLGVGAYLVLGPHAALLGHQIHTTFRPVEMAVRAHSGGVIHAVGVFKDRLLSQQAP